MMAGRISAMAISHDPDCPIARSLSIIGERWSLLILRNLFRDGPQRFADFQASLAGIAPNTLSARLKLLEANGIIEARIYERHPPRMRYALTAKGRELGPVMKALYAWGERHTGGGAPPAS